MNVNRTVIRNTYVNETVVHNTTIVNNNHVAYSGGPGGIRHDPTTRNGWPCTNRMLRRPRSSSSTFRLRGWIMRNYFKANNGHPQNVAVARPLPANQHPASVSAAGNRGARGNYNPQAGGVHGNVDSLSPRVVLRVVRLPPRRSQDGSSGLPAAVASGDLKRVLPAART